MTTNTVQFIETRCDDVSSPYGGIVKWGDLQKALQAVKKSENGIFRITFSLNNEYMRFRPKYASKKDKWSELSENKLRWLNKEYAKSYDNDDGQLFFVHQMLIGPNYESIKYNTPNVSDKLKEDLIMHDCIQECLTEKEFMEKYG